jgi:hypothetical protein
METLQKTLGCGVLYLSKNPKIRLIHLIVVNFSDIVNNIIPFFAKYPLQGAKNLDYQSFCKVVVLMKDKLHLTPLGLEQIKCIKSEMNRKRD